MLEIAFVLLMFGLFFAAGYQWGFAAGEKSMFRRFTSPGGDIQR